MTWKICLVGPQRSGKTRFAREILGVDRTEDFALARAETTLGVNLDLVTFEGEDLSVWDIGSVHPGLGKRYTEKSDGILRFHDSGGSLAPFSTDQSGAPLVDIFPACSRADRLRELLSLLKRKKFSRL